ncbi:uncharacterized protein PRCAT00001682001 [Priceomyces carsonii]|uniref:uncharacterized protein n=1 Tax=Priceomyces carsonii TaxID=28549 RepID=UPI002ED822D4|nr:unnamed protein product [Priceomyces carsonii]
MYAPKLFVDDLFMLWNNDGESNLLSPMSNNRKDHQNEYVEDQKRHTKQLYAPPLIAYLADRSGASISQLDYTIQTGVKSNVSLLTPLIKEKLDQLHMTRNFGYSTIRPVGIGKTMEQLQIEQNKRINSKKQSEELSFAATVENTSGIAPDSSLNEETNNISRIETIIMPNRSNDVDLDAQIPDADGIDSEVRDDDDFDLDLEEGSIGIDFENGIDEDEGFMAEEVEYQDDHSLNTEMNYSANVLINSGSTGVTIPVTSNSLGARSTVTNATSANTRGSTEFPNGGNHYSVSQVQFSSDDLGDDENANLDMIIDTN